MKLFTTCTFMMVLVFCQTGMAQLKTEEQRTTINKATGDTVTTESLIISESEDITPRSHIIIVNPLKFFLFYNLSYFYKATDQVAIGGGIQFPTISDLDGYGANLEFRIYPSKKSLRGFYVAPNFSYNVLKSNEEGEKMDAFSIGTLLGWQWFPGEEFAIGFGIGADYYIGSTDTANGDLEKYEGFVPAVRFDIGYAW